MTDHSLTIYQQLALQTRALRQAAGRYPTQAQRAAMKHICLRDGYHNATLADMLALAGHPYLTISQRQAWADRAKATQAA